MILSRLPRPAGLGDGEAYAAWRDWAREEGPRALVAAAVLAASPHNSQPWCFDLRDRTIDLRADPARMLGALDPTARERDVGLGCCLEHLLLAAPSQGLAADARILPDRDDPDLIARVELTRGPVRREALHVAVPHRHTDRSAFAPHPVPYATIHRLGGEARAGAGARVLWVTSGPARERLGDTLVRAAEAVTRDVEQSRDGFALFRSSPTAIRRNRDGLTLDGQGLSAPATAAARLLPVGRRRADAFWVDRTRDVHVRTAGAYGVIAVLDADDRLQRVAGGRLLARLHLAATLLGVALHPMNQITERADRERALGSEPVFGREAARLAPAGWAPLVVFRLGWPGGARGRRPSPRRPVDAVLR